MVIYLGVARKCAEEMLSNQQFPSMCLDDPRKEVQSLLVCISGVKCLYNRF